ncbi:unnamed protein product [Pneumocystis jirovecii]|uniref:UDP-N-acetylglucosamine--dolichyl-phosphate N-acetylglucosaminephosphotransferase n=1 Tax=Pneumocystis jirovecii TaxID=42068 RepID=L0PGQ4_PNEJI|nr:unnamed protein product [Pneumocystis jirovecii]
MGWLLNSFLFTICVAVVDYMINKNEHPLVVSLEFSIVSGFITFKIIPVLSPFFIKAGFHGKDLNKPGNPLRAEAMGIVCSVIYIFSMFLFIPFSFYKYFISFGSGKDTYELLKDGEKYQLFPHNKLGEYLSAILSLQSMVLLGIADDLFDIRWRYKLFMPALSAIPILVVYYVDFNVTYVLVPVFLQSFLGGIIQIGWWYYLYMAALSIFCPNSINIIAGINGVEVGQSIIISLCIIINDLFYVFRLSSTSIALFPASVFVGDTYCYFSGMIFAVVGIIGHFSKTILLFFIPQIFNFILSLPQLFGIVECPST